MPSVSGYAAGAETSDVILSYALESLYKTKPAVSFKQLRIRGESLAGTKSRQRFNEMTGKRQVSPSVTTGDSAGGGIDWYLSYGTFDDLLSCVLGADWTSALAINGSSADISTVATGNKLTSTTSGKFASIVENQYIRLYGFTAGGGANNGIYRVSSKVSDQELLLNGKTVTNETPTGTNAKVRGSMLRNGDLVKSLWLQKQIGAADFFSYPGAIVSSMTLQGAMNQAFSGSFQILATEEQDGDTDGSTGAQTAAPAGGFFDGVGNFGGVMLNDGPIDAVVQSVNIQVAREGAELAYGMGSPAAQGAMFGQVNPSGSLDVLFKNRSIYELFKAEAKNLFSWSMRDPDGNAYWVALQSCNLLNGSPQAAGPNQAVRSRFTIEGAQYLAGPCIQFDRFPAVP